MSDTYKVKYKQGMGKVVLEYTGTGYSMSMEEVHRLIDDPNVLQLTITKMTTKEYLKKAGAANE